MNSKELMHILGQSTKQSISTNCHIQSANPPTSL